MFIALCSPTLRQSGLNTSPPSSGPARPAAPGAGRAKPTAHQTAQLPDRSDVFTASPSPRAGGAVCPTIFSMAQGASERRRCPRSALFWGPSGTEVCAVMSTPLFRDCGRSLRLAHRYAELLADSSPSHLSRRAPLHLMVMICPTGQHPGRVDSPRAWGCSSRRPALVETTINRESISCSFNGSWRQPLSMAGRQDHDAI